MSFKHYFFLMFLIFCSVVFSHSVFHHFYYSLIHLPTICTRNRFTILNMSRVYGRALKTSCTKRADLISVWCHVNLFYFKTIEKNNFTLEKFYCNFNMLFVKCRYQVDIYSSVCGMEYFLTTMQKKKLSIKFMKMKKRMITN